VAAIRHAIAGVNSRRFDMLDDAADDGPVDAANEIDVDFERAAKKTDPSSTEHLRE